MNRRRFLKYASLGVGAAAAATIGSYYLQREQQPTPAPTSSRLTSALSSATTTLIPSLTTSPMKVTLRGTCFHDYHGNGIITKNAPLLDQVEIVLKDGDGREYSAVTGSDGKYQFDSVPVGQYQLYLKPNRHYPERDFRYWSKSAAELAMLEWRGEPVGHYLGLTDDAQIDLGLVIGQFTLPFQKGTNYEIVTKFGERNWDGTIQTGTDFVVYSGNKNVTKGTPLLAAAPGIVTGAGYADLGGNIISIRHTDGLYENIQSLYAHLSTILVGQGDTVKRGQLIGKCGFSGRNPRIPHLHFELDCWAAYIGGQGSPVNPYRIINNPNSKCYWTKDNDPQYP